MVAVTRLAAEAVVGNGYWMAWNLMLALVPLALAVLLFSRPARHGPAWWLALAAFVAFLPNAPYVLTDVIHLVDDAQTVPSDAVMSFVVIPQYAAFFLVGFQAYVGSLLLVGRWLVRSGRASWVVPVELALHGLCAVGIHLGRFDRLNSWDVVHRPSTVGDGLTGLDPVLVLVAFVAVAGCYSVMKRVTLALVLLYRPDRARARV
jgi:uncharacterized membrane protein